MCEKVGWEGISNENWACDTTRASVCTGRPEMMTPIGTEAMVWEGGRLYSKYSGRVCYLLCNHSVLSLFYDNTQVGWDGMVRSFESVPRFSASLVKAQSTPPFINATRLVLRCLISECICC